MEKRYFIPLLLSGIALSMCISCKKDSVPSSPGQPALSKIIKDGALETEFLYVSGKGLVRTNYYDSETGQLSSFNKRSEENTSELQSLMRISYTVLCLKKNLYEQNNTQLVQYYILLLA